MTTITENRWVKYFGFQRFPFDCPKAGNEEFACPDFYVYGFEELQNLECVFGQANTSFTALLLTARPNMDFGYWYPETRLQAILRKRFHTVVHVHRFVSKIILE